MFKAFFNTTFREALIANMRFHWEWDRILFPEKYAPKEPAALGKEVTEFLLADRGVGGCL